MELNTEDMPFDNPVPSPFLVSEDPASLFPRWTKWKEAFLFYLSTTGVIDADQQKFLLIQLLGQEVREMIVNLTNGNSILNIMCALDKYFLSMMNIRYKRYIFRQAAQEWKEPIDMYVTRLKKLASNCDYIDISDVIIDQIIEKCYLPKLRHVLLIDSDLTLEKLLKIGRALEIMEHESTPDEGSHCPRISGTSVGTSAAPCFNTSSKAGPAVKGLYTGDEEMDSSVMSQYTCKTEEPDDDQSNSIAVENESMLNELDHKRSIEESSSIHFPLHFLANYAARPCGNDPLINDEIKTEALDTTLDSGISAVKESDNDDEILKKEDFCQLMKFKSNDDIALTIKWMKEQGLLRSNVACHFCQQVMNWTKRTACRDKYIWKCQNKNCVRFKSSFSIRAKSFFVNSNVDLPKWLHIMYLWTIGENLENTSKQVGMSCNSLISYFSSFRNICKIHFQLHPIQLGGPGVVVAMDESCFSDKRKAAKLKNPVWVLGIVDTTTTPSKGYMEVVENTDAVTLFPIIATVVRPGSIVHTEKWRMFNLLQGMEDNHGTVDHLINFVPNDPEGVSVRAMQSYWTKHKNTLKKMKGIKWDFFNSYIHQMLWQERYCNDSFMKLCEHIKDAH